MIISGDDPVSKGAHRFEIFTGAGKRREWTPEVKASIVAECWPGGERVSIIARRHGLDRSQIYAWRKEFVRQFKDRGLTVPTPPEAQAAAFVPAVITPDIEPACVPQLAPVRRRPRRRQRVAPGVVELKIDGVAVKIARGADAGVIAAVIDALKARA